MNMYDLETTVAEIELKIRKLMKENELLRQGLERADGECRKLQEQNEQLNILINNLKEENNNLKLGNTLTRKGDSVEIRLKLNQLIRRIDKSLELINKSE